MPESIATTSTDAPQSRGPLRRAAAAASGIGVGLALTAGLALAALMLIPAALGYERYVITGDSMDGAIDRGSLVYERAVPTSELRVGDVITYQPPPDTGLDGLVTHRIVSITEGRHGEPVFRTEGDTNEAPDVWRFTLDEPTQARAVFHVPYVG